MKLARTPDIWAELVDMSKIAFYGDVPFEAVRQAQESGRVAEAQYTTDSADRNRTATFSAKWIFRPSHALPFLPSPIVTDTDSDGRSEVLFTDGENRLYGVRGDDGSTQWHWSPPFGRLTPGQNDIISINDDTGGAKRAVVVTTFVTRPFRVYVLDPRPGVTTNRYFWSATLAHEPLPGGISKIFHRTTRTFLGLSVRTLEPATHKVETSWFDVRGRQQPTLGPLQQAPADSYNDHVVLAGEDLYDFGGTYGLRSLQFDENEYMVLDGNGKGEIRIKRDAAETRLQNDLFFFCKVNDVCSLGHLSLTGDQLTLSEYNLESRKLEHEYVTQLNMSVITSGFGKKWNMSHSEHIPERRGVIQIADIDGDHRWELLLQLDDALVAVDTPFELPFNQLPRVESANSTHRVDHETVVRSWIPYGSGSRLLVR